MGIESLPVEIIGKIFEMLGPRDRISVMLVCQEWMEECERQIYWTWVHLTLDMFKVSILPEMLECHRLKGLRSLTLESDITDVLLLKIKKWTKLEYLSMENMDLSLLNPKLLSFTVTRVKKVKLAMTNLNNSQLVSIFTDIRDRSQLIDLDVSENDLSSLQQNFLKSVVNLKSISLNSTNLNMMHIEAISIALDEYSLLVSLNLSDNNLQLLRPSKLSSFSKLTVLRVHGTHLTRTL